VEIENCSEYLVEQVRLIEPKVICTLGNFATKLLRADPTGITRLHGRPEEREVLGVRRVRLYPLLHPAAALYTPRMLDTLREDFARLPALLALPAPAQPEAAESEPVDEGEAEAVAAAEPEPLAEAEPLAEPDPIEQLGLF
jgi:DNA polymerase